MFCMEHEVLMTRTYRSDTDTHVYTNYISLKETPLPPKRKKTNLWFKEKSNSQSKIDFRTGQGTVFGRPKDYRTIMPVSCLVDDNLAVFYGEGGEGRGEGEFIFLTLQLM